MRTITHDFVNFNADHLGKITFEEFQKEFENTKVYAKYSPADREKLLKEAHVECQKAIGIEEKPAKTSKKTESAETSAK